MGTVSSTKRIGLRARPVDCVSALWLACLNLAPDTEGGQIGSKYIVSYKNSNKLLSHNPRLECHSHLTSRRRFLPTFFLDSQDLGLKKKWRY